MSIIEISVFLVLTFASSLAIIRYSKNLRSKGVGSVMKSQSVIHSKTRLYAEPIKQKPKRHSQSRNYVSERMIKIIAIDGKAYWVKDNVFYTAEIQDGAVNHDTTKEVDTINMSKDDLDKMLFIMDSIKEEE